MTTETGYTTEQVLYADFRVGEEITPDKIQALFRKAETMGCKWIEIFKLDLWFCTYQNDSGKWFLRKQSLRHGGV